MYVGSLSLDLLLGDVRSLKQKRSVVRPLVSELRRRYAVSAAEAGHLDLHRRALVGVAAVAPDAAHCRELLDACERLVAGHPEVELLSARQRLWNDHDSADHDSADHDSADHDSAGPADDGADEGDGWTAAAGGWIDEGYAGPGGPDEYERPEDE